VPIGHLHRSRTASITKRSSNAASLGHPLPVRARDVIVGASISCIYGRHPSEYLKARRQVSVGESLDLQRLPAGVVT